jgi:hypothetical protein
MAYLRFGARLTAAPRKERGKVKKPALPVKFAVNAYDMIFWDGGKAKGQIPLLGRQGRCQ